jgi:PhzF family phenazine biosynthesis protein
MRFASPIGIGDLPRNGLEFRQNPESQGEVPAVDVSGRCFLQLGAWVVPTVFMGIAKTTFGRATPTQTEQIEVVHTRVFAIGSNGGNPCPVIPFADTLTESQMQQLARKFDLDTAFVLRPESKGADIRIRYFVPDHEMGVSGHATIAAITVAQLDNVVKSDFVRVETITGTFAVESLHHNEETLVTLEQDAPVFGPAVAPDAVARALKINKEQIAIADSPVQSVSVSRAKLLVPLEDSTVLNRLKPDYDALWEVCDRLQVTGFYPFTRRTDKPNAFAEARQFPLRAGFPEDAATGVAAAALGAYFATYDQKCQPGQHRFQIAQGYAMGAPSLIEAIAECSAGKITRTAIRGVAQVVRRERITL